MKKNYSFKTATKIFRTLIFATAVLLSTFSLSASHFRYGSITWSKVTGSTNQVKFVTTQSWRTSAFFGTQPAIGSIVNTGPMSFGDGGTANIALVVTSVNPAEDWFEGQYTVNHTYPAPSGSAVVNYTANFSSCCRISTLKDGNNDQAFVISTVVNVGNSNNSPVSTMPAIIAMQQGISNTYTIPSFDPDNDNLTFSVATSAESGLVTVKPSGLTLSSAGVITWTPTTALNSLHSLSVKVSDGKTHIMLDFIIKVVQVSTPPVFDYTVTPVNGKIFKVSPGDAVSFTVKATDSDPSSTVKLSGSGIPSGASWNPSTTGANPASSTFSWTPTNSQLGSNVISFIATDNNGVQTSTSITIIVTQNPKFVSPTPSDLTLLVYTPGDTIEFDVKALDPDNTDLVTINNVQGLNASNVRVALNDAMYSGSSLSVYPSAQANPTSTSFTWNTSTSQWGLRQVIFTAEDLYAGKTEHKVNILLNTTPVINTTAPTSVHVGETYTYEFEAYDPDVDYGDELEIHVIGLPSWATYTDNGDGTVTITGVPGVLDIGINEVTIQVHDAFEHDHPGGTPAEIYNLEVLPCSLEAKAKDISVELGSNGSVSIAGTDIDNSSISGCGIDFVTVTPSNFDCSNIGNNTVNYTITDIYGNTSTASCVVTVSDNTAPVVITKNITVTLVNGAASITAADIDNNSSDNCGIQSMSIDNSSFTCSNIGDNTVTLTVIDKNGISNTATATVTVIGTIPTVAIAQSNQPNFCQGGNIILTATGSSNGTYLWGNASTTAAINVNSSGTYSVTFTNTYGCKATASASVTYTAANLLSAYTIIATKEAEIEEYSSVSTGGVGVTSSCGEIEVKGKSTITGSNTFAKAKKVSVANGSTVTNKLSGSASTVTLPNFLANPKCKNDNGNHEDEDDDDDDDYCWEHKKNCKNHNSCSKNNKNYAKDIKVKKNTKVTLSDSVYGKIQIESGAKVTFSSAVVYADKIETSKNDTLIFSGCTKISLCDKMKIGQDNVVNAANKSIVFYVNDEVNIEKGTNFNGSIYTKDRLETIGNKNDEISMTGLFIAEKVHAHYTSFNWSTSCGSCGNMFLRSSEQPVTNQDNLRTEKVYLNVYPNPSNGLFNLAVNADLKGALTVQVINSTGQVVYKTVESDFTGLAELQINLTEQSAGIYYVRAEVGGQTFVTKIQNLK